MFRLLCLCSEDLGAHAIVLAKNKQTCMFFVHVFHHFKAYCVGTIAKHALVLPFSTKRLVFRTLLVSANVLSAERFCSFVMLLDVIQCCIFIAS
jgi:hypothetical protein